MRLFPLVLVVAAASLASCGNGSDDNADQRGSASPKPSLQIPIDTDWQQSQLMGCNKRMQHYRTKGVWKHGGVAPGVALDAWEKLSDEERTEIFQIAACIGSSGEMAERTVSVSVEGNGREIETRKVISDRDFSAQLSAR